MIIRTETYRDLENDIADLFDIDNSYLYERLCEIYDENKDANDYGEKMQEDIEQFIDENLNSEFILEEVYLYHLARLISVPSELRPLKDLAIAENDFSKFLRENKIELVEKNGKLELYYKHKWIPAENFQIKRQSLLAKRLGHLGEADFCVNGFLFWPNIEKTSHNYYIALRNGPEIIENLGRFLETDLLSKYRKQSKYYGVVLRSPIEKIIFDGQEKVNGKSEKTRLFLKKALYTLMGYYNNCPSDCNNPIIRFNDEERVPIDHVIEIAD